MTSPGLWLERFQLDKWLKRGIRPPMTKHLVTFTCSGSFMLYCKEVEILQHSVWRIQLFSFSSWHSNLHDASALQKIWTAALLANAEVHSFLVASALAKLRVFFSSQNPGDGDAELQESLRQVRHGRRPFRQCLSMPQDMPQEMPDVSRHGRSGASLGSEPGFRCGSAFAAAGWAAKLRTGNDPSMFDTFRYMPHHVQSILES